MDIKVKDLFCRPADERALLAYCMKGLNYYFEVCAKLTPADFLYYQHEMIMLTFEALAAKGAEKFEPTLIISEATAGGYLDNIGGLKYVQSISSINVDDSNFRVYLNTVYEATTKAKLFNLLNNNLSTVEKNAKDGMESIELVSSVESELLSLTTEGMKMDEPVDLKDGLGEYIEERRENKVDLTGISTGYPILDKQIDGLIPGTLFIIAARKKKGKSVFLANVAAHIAYRLKKAVLYVDTELSFEEFRSRTLSTISGVKERDIKHGGYDDATYNRLLKAKRIIDKGKLFHEYMPGYSVDKLVALYKKYKHKEDIGLIVFDYIKEPDSTSIDRQRKEYQVLGDVTTKLKDLAGQLKIPAITAVQLNRDNDIADSDRIARYADVICLWGPRTDKELEAGGMGCGTHKLMIKDTRRGGATSEEGIGYNLFKEFLRVKEVGIDKQYFTNFQKTINAGSASDYEGYENEELF